MTVTSSDPAYPFIWKLVNNIYKPFFVDKKGREQEAAWAPLPGSQVAFITCPHFEANYSGGRGFGKTDSLIMDWASEVGKGYGRAWKGIIFRKTLDQLREVIDKTLELFPRIFPGAKWNATEKVWTMPDGETLKMRYMERPSDYWNYHGHQYAWIGWEELTTWATDECYLRMMSTCRSSNPNIPRRVRSTTNPYGVGHNWVKERFGLPALPDHYLAKPISYTMKNPLTNEKVTVTRVGIVGHMKENFVMLHATPDYPATIANSATNEAEKKAWMDGDWDVVAGGMFDDLWATGKARIIREPFEIPRGWRIDRSFDWGSSAPFSVGWWAESDGSDVTINGKLYSTVRGDLFRIAEWYGWSGKPNEGLRMTATEISKGIIEREKAMGLYGRVSVGVADSSIFSVENGTSIAIDMQKPVTVENKILPGITWVRADKRPGSRKHGWELVRKMFKQAAQPAPREGPGLFVFNTCEQFLRTMPTLPRDLKKDPDDVDTESEDHIADDTRYRVRFSGQRTTAAKTVGI